MSFGAHMPTSGGVVNAFGHGERVGCETMQIFTRNQRQWNAKPYSEQEVADYQQAEQRASIHPVVSHASYLINMASPDDALWEKSIAAFGEELQRCATLAIPYVVVHPGAHTGSGEEAGLQRIADALNRLFADGVGAGVTVLLENTAGQGSTLGWQFDHLARLVDRCAYPARLGVCFDTCHAFAAGYDLRTADTYHTTFSAFEQVLGLDYIKVFHLNDSMHELASRKDRHNHIGQGFIGVEGFRLLVNDPRFHRLPMILETPKDKDLTEDVENLALLRSLCQ
jgi:deoxyribonuclease IV